jgi:hypothetical protein
MKNIQKKFVICFGTLSLATATWFWVHAQEDATPNAPPPPSADAPSTNGDAASADKWEQVKKNNEDMAKSLEAIQQNLQFIKARAMSGGRHS